MLTAVIQNIWENEVMPKDWKEVVTEIVFNGKGHMDECNNLLGISLLATAGKVLSQIRLDQLQIYVANEILLETQSGFKDDRGAVDMIFSAQHL